MSVQVEISRENLQGFSDALKKAPKRLYEEIAVAYHRIGRTNLEKIRADVNANFNLQSQGAANSFRAKSTDPSLATDFRKLFLTVYTRWKAAEIFQTGGVIRSNGKYLMVQPPRDGKRRLTVAKIQSMLLNKKARIIATPRGYLIVSDKGGLTKRGAVRKNSRTDIIALLRKSVTERKRLSFTEIIESGEGIHNQLMADAVENTLASVVEGK